MFHSLLFSVTKVAKRFKLSIISWKKLISKENIRIFAERLDMEKVVILIVTIFALCLGSCKNNSVNNPKQMVDTLSSITSFIQKTSRLYTSEYHIHKIITHKDTLKLEGSILKNRFNIDLPFGQRFIAIPIDATIKAYIDFNNFSDKNIEQQGNKIIITLPDPHIIITSSKINHSGIKRHVSLIRSNFSDQELSSYEKQGRDSIIKSIPQLGIIRNAQQNAANIFIPMLKMLGFSENNITISFRKEYNKKDIFSLIDNTTIEGK